MRSNALDFTQQARTLMRSFPRPAEDGLSPDVTLSFLVEPPSQNSTESARCSAYYNSKLVGHTSSYRKLCQLLSWQLWWCSDEVTEYLLLLSGAVSSNGKGIILPGVSRSGKSCLTLALLREGYRYMSDGIAAIDPSTRKVHAFPKAIGIRDASVFPELASRDDLLLGPVPNDSQPVWWVHPKVIAKKPSVGLKPQFTSDRYLQPADLMPIEVGEAVPIRYIIFPIYDPSAEPELRPLAPAEALKGLLEVARNHRKFGNKGLHLLAALVKKAQCFSLKSNDLRGSVSLINQLTGTKSDKCTYIS